MSESQRDDLLDRVLRLPEGDRVWLARQLLQGVEQFELTDAERVELREAMAEIDQGDYVDEAVILRDLGIFGVIG